jgi:PAS domain S-box-containing protein
LAQFIERQRAEQALKKSEVKYRTLLENLQQKIFFMDKNFTYVSCNENYARDLKIKPEKIVGKTDYDFYPKQLAEKYRADDKRIIESGETEDIEEIYLQDGQEIWVHTVKTPVKDEKGTVVGILGIFWDITEKKRAEEQIKASLKEKEVLLQEVHHRVKNNMQIISSLFSLQSGHIKDKQALEIFKSSQNRVRSMALIHERLYKSKDMARVDFADYVQSLTTHLFSSYGINTNVIKLHIDIKDVSLDINTAIPCSLIINELVSNSLKHAFPTGKKGEIKISIHTKNKNEIELLVSDNGVGFPKKMDFRKTDSLGLHLVNLLAEDQLHGDIKLDRTKGAIFHIKFKVKQ